MMSLKAMQDLLVHRLLKRPYVLFCRFDQGRGKTIVLLHGIASSGDGWRYVLDKLKDAPVRVVVFDLLGFGRSPKPADTWVAYDVTDHARAVQLSLKKRRVKGPVIMVGHSMGCFVAVKAAASFPGLVDRLLLYEPPFYAGLPKKNSYRIRQATYFRLYEWLLKERPIGANRLLPPSRLLRQVTGLRLTEDTWIPFERSMRNTIMQQTALRDLKRLSTPTQILYGRYDHLVFNDKNNLFFGEAATHISVGQVSAMHMISRRASRVIAKRIVELAGTNSGKLRTL